jgi:aspartate ammonia-lyase
LIAANGTLTKNLFDGLTIDKKIAEEKFFYSPVITTALIPYIGYKKATQIANAMRKEQIDVFIANEHLKLIEANRLKAILSIDKLLQTGYTIGDVLE